MQLNSPSLLAMGLAEMSVMLIEFRSYVCPGLMYYVLQSTSEVRDDEVAEVPEIVLGNRRGAPKRCREHSIVFSPVQSRIVRSLAPAESQKEVWL